jgi:hypothetical protein
LNSSLNGCGSGWSGTDFNGGITLSDLLDFCLDTRKTKFAGLAVPMPDDALW